MNLFQSIQTFFRATRKAWCGVVFLLLTGTLQTQAQSLGAYNGTGCTFNSSSDVNAGCTASGYLTVQYNMPGNNFPSGWNLRVRANGNFSNGSTTIAPQYISIGFNSAPSGPSVSGSGFQTLNTGSFASLLSSTSAITAGTYYFEQRFDMKITGGSHLTVGTGTYTGTITLIFVDKNGNTVATKSDVSLSFTVNYSNTCTGATIGTYASNAYSFSNYAQQMSGTTVTDAVSVQYNPNQATCMGWSLKVRAASNFTNGANSVPVQYFSLRFNRVSSGSPTASAIGVTNTPVALSTSDVTLINPSNAGFTAYSGTEHKFDMIIQGGNQLLVPNGTYTASLVFTLYNQDNQVVSTSTLSISFQVNSSTNGYTAVFQNGAENIDLAFTSPASYASGVSVTKTNGLKITGYSPYQVIVKTSGPNLVSTTSSATIPVSVVSLEIVKSSATSGGINTYTRQLSATDQIVITNPLIDYTQQVVQYNLRYYTTGGDSRIAGTGSFNTSVIFVVMPQ